MTQSSAYANPNITSTSPLKPAPCAHNPSPAASFAPTPLNAFPATTPNSSSSTTLLISVCANPAISYNKNSAHYAHLFIQGVRTARNLITPAPRVTLIITLFMISSLTYVCASSCIMWHRVLSVGCVVMLLPIAKVVWVDRKTSLHHV